MVGRMARQKPIVILGGGFGGVYTARHLETILADHEEDEELPEVILINRYNYFLMTPLLFEAGSGVLEPRHAVSPIRSLFDRVRFVEAEVQEVDFERSTILAHPPGNLDLYELEFSHLVIAVGGVTNTDLIPGAQHALTFKVLGDAIFLRNHCIELFERADVETDPEFKRRLLNFVIAGGGLVGMELVGELAEFLKNLSRSYPRIHPTDLRIELIEGGAQLMKEMDRDLADYAQRILSEHGVRFRTCVRVHHIVRHMGYYSVHLPDGQTIKSSTVIVATGVKTNPLLDGFPLEKDRKGRLLTEPTMLCVGRKNIWSLGDCAHIPDPQGQPYPQLAQHALREARVLAGNLLAAIRGKPLQPFIYEKLGTLAALGHYKGVGKVKGVKIRGFIGWWVWRTYYLFQMPRWSRRIRIMFDWTIAMIFKNDIVELNFWDSDTVMRRKPGPPVEPVEHIAP